MLVRVTCDGIVIGTTELDPGVGLAHGVLSPAAAYVLIDSAARTVGRELTGTKFWSAIRGDFACVVAARWEGGRLAIEDMAGRELCANNVAVIERSFDGAGERTVRVVADFRSDVARAQARYRSSYAGSENRTRPAA